MSKLTPALVEALVPAHLRCRRLRAELRRRYSQEQIVVLEDLWDSATLAKLRQEAEDLRSLARRRDFIMPHYQTPRHMSVVGGQTVLSHAPAIAALYIAFPPVALLSDIVGRPLSFSRQRDAFLTLNILERHGDTQGWHLDDGAPAAIYALSAPSAGQGGELEYIRDWPTVQVAAGDPSVAAGVALARSRGLLRSLSLRANAMYLLQADTTLHRVVPLKQPIRPRIVIAAGYEADPVAVYSHTGGDLYGGA